MLYGGEVDVVRAEETDELDNGVTPRGVQPRSGILMD